jgi:hypothetical protein
MADTWAGDASNQCVNGYAVIDGGFVDGPTIPYPSKILTKYELGLYTWIPIGNEPLASMPSNRCPTKGQIEATL